MNAPLLPYHNAPIVFFPVTAEQVMPNTLPTLNQGFFAGIRKPYWTEALTVFREKPTPFSSCSKYFGHVLRQRRVEIGIPAKTQARSLGMSQRALAKIEADGHLGNQIGYIQILAYLYNIRFNFLPFFGPPLTDPEAILRDLVARSLTIRLSPQSKKFSQYTGISYAEICDMITQGIMTEDLFQTLVHKWHMRVWPPVPIQKKTLTEERLPLLVQSLKFLLAEWQMTQDEFGQQSLGVARGTTRHFCCQPHEFTTIQHKLAPAFGYVIPDSEKTELLKTKPQYLDSQLVETIEQRRLTKDWSVRELCRRTDTDPNILDIIYKTLQTPYGDAQKGHIKAMPTLLRICNILNISLHSTATLPKTTIQITGNNEADAKALAIELKQRRLKLRLSHNALIEIINKEGDAAGLGTGNLRTLKVVEAAIFNKRNLIVAEKAFATLGIEYDPFEHLTPIKIDSGTTRQELSEILKSRFQSCLISNKKMAELTGLSRKTLSNLLSGQGDHSNNELRKLCRLLKIYLTPLGHSEQAKKEQLLFSLESLLTQHKTSRLSLQKMLNISEEEYYRILRGDFSFDELAVIEINNVINKQPVVERNISKQKWAEGIQARLQHNKDTPEQISQQLNIPLETLNSILSGDFFWNSEDVLFLAQHYHFYTWEILQCALEDSNGDWHFVWENAPAFDTTEYFTAYQLLNSPKGKLRNQRSIFLHKYATGTALSAAEIDFLTKTGGTPEQLKTASLGQVFYLYSLGDTMSLSLFATHNNISAKEIVRQYTEWVLQMYGHTITPDKPIKIRGKIYPVCFDTQGLISMLKILKQQNP